MKLSKALKQKKKLVSKVERAYSKFQEYNSHRTDETPPYDPKESYEEWMKLTDELVKLKSDTIQATAGIYPKIFRMSECKSIIQRLQCISTESGERRQRVTAIDQDPIIYKAFIGLVKKDDLIIELEEEIETLQSEIEVYNSTTQI